MRLELLTSVKADQNERIEPTPVLVKYTDTHNAHELHIC